MLNFSVILKTSVPYRSLECNEENGIFVLSNNDNNDSENNRVVNFKNLNAVSGYLSMACCFDKPNVSYIEFLCDFVKYNFSVASLSNSDIHDLVKDFIEMFLEIC